MILCCCMWAISSSSKTQGLQSTASVVVAHGLSCPWCGVFPIERTSPALAGGFFTAGPPGKFSLSFLRNWSFWSKLPDLFKLVFSVISSISSGSVLIIPVSPPLILVVCVFLAWFVNVIDQFKELFIFKLSFCFTVYYFVSFIIAFFLLVLGLCCSFFFPKVILIQFQKKAVTWIWIRKHDNKRFGFSGNTRKRNNP